MNANHHDKVEQFYSIQETIYRILGAFKLTNNNSKTKQMAHKIHRMLCFLWVAAYTLSLLISFIILPSILDKIMKVFYMLGTMIGAMAKLAYVKKYANLYRELAKILHKNIFNPLDKTENDIFLKHFEMSKFIRNWYGYVSFISLIYSFVLQQVLNSHELPAEMYTPFNMDISTNLMMAKIYSFIAVGCLCFLNCIAFDSWCTGFLIFTQAQLEILEYRLERIGKYSTSDFEINIELKSCIRLHAEVYEVIGKLEKAIAFPVSLQIFCSMLVLCCNFYAISFTSIGDSPIAFLKFSTGNIYQIAMLSQIFLICYFANEVTLVSNKLSHALYSSNWIEWNKINRKLVLLTMLRFRNPIKVRSLNRCYHFDLEAFTSIVNTSYSYFALLKQMNN
ncbi:LOW QUALITY PROTEIN: odorant receptor 46a [Episyrphus balteatus]|uniref:LOW QUALITY PROTEIN: odorant receptor 46a n=1 Tax=Episyrphus balteatus TaxID=286459 RepID=UPI002485443C|nr:LOW QUALITY PROTEIN: odorant receptor 46a [Episyrphus balteatus]